MRNGEGLGGRRQWLRDCSLLAVAVAATGPLAGAAQAAAPARRKLLVVGDSLSAEYGLARGTGWVALLAQRIDQRKLGWDVVNASISGDTTSGGLARLPALLKEHKPSLVVIELGGNDALRGLPLASSEKNMLDMVRAAKAVGARVLLLGMQVPPNYGRKYTEDFARMFQSVAQSEQAALVPFFLAGVADRPDADAWFQPDRIHPKAEAHPRMLDNAWAALQPLLR